MRVLHIDAGNLFGGVETFLLTLARCRDLCPEMRPEFAVCFEGRLAEELCRAGVRVHRLGEVRARNPLQVLRARRRLARILASGEIDVVVCHMPWVHAIFGPVVRKVKIPLVFWLHGEANRDHWVERWARLANPDLVICNSRYTETTLDAIFPNVPSKVLYYPVAGPSRAITESERAAVRRECDTEVEDVVIIQVGRLEAWKGQALCLEALATLRSMAGWTCWIVGGPQRPHEADYLERLRRRCSEMELQGRVKFLGQRSDTARLLAAADIFCQPNTAPEPFGIVFIEAMIAGLPVVSSAVGGPLEFIDDECGVLIEPGNVSALAASLERFIGDQSMRRRVGAAGLAKAARLCEPASQIKQICCTLAGISRDVGRDQARKGIVR